MTRLDGMKVQKDCADCGVTFDNEIQPVRCDDCLDAAYRCRDCTCNGHSDKPLHRIYVSLHVFLLIILSHSEVDMEIILG